MNIAMVPRMELISRSIGTFVFTAISWLLLYFIISSAFEDLEHLQDIQDNDEAVKYVETIFDSSINYSGSAFALLLLWILAIQ